MKLISLTSALAAAAALTALLPAQSASAATRACSDATFEYNSNTNKEVQTQRCLRTEHYQGGEAELAPEALTHWCKYLDSDGEWHNAASCSVQGTYRLTSPSGTRYTGSYPQLADRRVLVGEDYPCETGTWTLRNQLIYTLYVPRYAGSSDVRAIGDVESRKQSQIDITDCS